jgi:hypothetical protein
MALGLVDGLYSLLCYLPNHVNSLLFSCVLYFVQSELYYSCYSLTVDLHNVWSCSNVYSFCWWSGQA